jgi:hypothetical protein
MRLRNLIALFLIAHGCSACQTAKSPTALDIATVAVATVDTALAVAIDLDRSDAGNLEHWEGLVIKVELASDVVRSAGDLCPHIPTLQFVAAAIGCDKCVAPLAAAKEQLKCQ